MDRIRKEKIDKMTINNNEIIEIRTGLNSYLIAEITNDDDLLEFGCENFFRKDFNVLKIIRNIRKENCFELFKKIRKRIEKKFDF